MVMFLKSFLLLVFAFNITIGLGKQLIYVHSHFRHGARSAEYLNEENRDSLNNKWTHPGELTTVGERQEYLLGYWNRLKYIKNNNFLSSIYDPHELLVYSTNYNRTIMSASSMLQGMFPLSSNYSDKLNEVQKSHAFPQVPCEDSEIQTEIGLLENYGLRYGIKIYPVHNINIDEEGVERKLILLSNNKCRAKEHKFAANNYDKSKELQEKVNKFNTEYAEGINDYLTRQGRETSDTYTYMEIISMTDDFISGYTQGLINNFTEETGINETEFLEFSYDNMGKYFSHYYYGDENAEVAKIVSNPFFQIQLSYMARRVNLDISKKSVSSKDYSYPKMVMTSGHDGTVGSDMILLSKIFNISLKDIYKYPKYAAQITYEVSRESSEPGKNYSDYDVSFWINDELIFTKKLDEYFNEVLKYILTYEEMEEWCGISSGKTKYKNNKALIIAFVVYGIISLAVVALLIIILIKSRKKESVTTPQTISLVEKKESINEL